MLKFRNSHKTLAFNYFTIFYVIAMFLPRLVVQGMFGDGLLYSSMARNMSIGKGSMWQPFFSTGYWIDNLPTTYYENPPLMLWFESLFFRAFGDFWWVEKVFCVFIFTVNCLLLLKIWQFFEKKYLPIKGMGFSVLIFWYLIPTVIWGNPNNMMDSNLLTFCLLSIWLILKAINDVKPHLNTTFLRRFLPFLFILLGSLSVFLGILTKGPVALYPLSIPILFAFFTKEISIKKAFYDTLLLSFFSALFFLALIYFSTDAKSYFTIYWQQRLLAVIVGSRDDMKLSGWEHFEILKTLFIEILPILIVFLVGFIVLKIKKIDIIISEKYKGFALFFFFLGLSATLPIMISTKQSAIYLIPGLPMFAFSAAFLALPFFERLVNLKMFSVFSLRLKYFSWLGLGVTLIYSAAIMGNYGRDKLLLSDVENLKKLIPQDAKVGVRADMMENFVFHVNLQRFCRIELAKTKPTTYFLTLKKETDFMQRDSLISKGYKNLPFDNHYFVVYKKG